MSAIVLDPFGGSGTTLLVARKLGRNSIGLELSYDYILQARERLGISALDRWTNGESNTMTSDYESLPMFKK